MVPQSAAPGESSGVAGNSAPSSSPRDAAAPSASNNDDGVEITLDVHDESEEVHSANPAALDEGSSSIISADDGGAGWHFVEKLFDEHSVDGRLSRNRFSHCVGISKQELAVALFDVLTREHNISGDSISKAEMREICSQISNTSIGRRLFDMEANNEDGRITEDEVNEANTPRPSKNKFSKSKEERDMLPSDLGYLRFEDMEQQLLDASPRQSVNQMLRQSIRPTAEPNQLRRWYRRARYFLEDNWKRVWVTLLWLSVCAGLFAWKFVQYRQRRHAFEVLGYCICVAKGGAETLKLNMALVLLPVCRNAITWIRNLTFVTRAVPFDDNLNLHKAIAAGVGVGVGLHVIPHLACNFPRLLHATGTEYAPLAQYFGRRPQNYYQWFLKGVEGWTGIVMLVLMLTAFTLAMPWFRHGRVRLPGPLKRLTGFNAFWYSHHLLVIVYALLVAHGHEWYKRSTWMYLAGPVCLYACERLIRALRPCARPVKVLKAVVYPGRVLSLHLSKPEGFRYKSGQYIFINCPAVSSFQWHPICITSAPQDRYLTVHIRTLGDWTRDLLRLFTTVCEPPMDGKSGLLRAEYNNMRRQRLPKVLIDGPYGMTAQDYKQYDVVLLISLGIGVTPMISILKDIINNTKQQLDDDLECGDASNNCVPSPFRTRRAYFYWVTREQGCFNWFRSVIEEVVEKDEKGVIELHNYCTSIYQEGHVPSTLELMFAWFKYIDIDTRFKVHFGRPNWCDVYKRIALNHRDKRVGVFYSGCPLAVKELRELSQDFSRKTTTKFELHKETF